MRRLHASYATALVLCAVLLTLSACAKSERAPHAAPVAPLKTENPVAMIPAAGARWLVVGSPRKLLGNEATRDALARLLAPERLDAFATQTGIDLRQADAGMVAGFDLSTVYGVTQQAGANARVLAAFRERLRGGERVFEPHPRLRRVSGTIGDVPQALLTVGDRTALVSVGDPRLVRVAEAFALGKLTRSPPALRGAAASRASTPPASALAVLWLFGPFTDEWSRAAGGLLGVTDGVMVALLPEGPGVARVQVEFAGEFVAEDRERLLEVATSLAKSTTGRVLGLDRPARGMEAAFSSGYLTLNAAFETQPIADGLYAAVAGEAWEILNLPTPHLHRAPESD